MHTPGVTQRRISTRHWDDEAFWQRCRAIPLPDALREVDQLPSDLQSCYDGSVIPLLFRGLSAEDELLRAQAHLRLTDEIEHQGSHFASTAKVIPLLARLLVAHLAGAETPWLIETLRTPGFWRLVPVDLRRQLGEAERSPLYRSWYSQAPGLRELERGLSVGSVDAELGPLRVSRRWHLNGQVAEAGCYFDSRGRMLKHGDWQCWASDGRLLGQYSIQRGSGVERGWFDSGEPARELQVSFGLPDGVERRWAEGGTLLHETAWKAGKRNGEDKSYFLSGAPQSIGSYVDGMAQGVFREWSPEGELVVEQAYARDKKHGRATTYAAGQKRSEGNYRDGKRHGLWQTWNGRGELERAVTWKNNRPDQR